MEQYLAYSRDTLETMRREAMNGLFSTYQELERFPKDQHLYERFEIRTKLVAELTAELQIRYMEPSAEDEG